MTRRRWILIAILVVILAIVGQRQFGTHTAPTGQPPLASIGGSLETFRADFNQAADAVRVIVLLSPT